MSHDSFITDILGFSSTAHRSAINHDEPNSAVSMRSFSPASMATPSITQRQFGSVNDDFAPSQGLGLSPGSPKSGYQSLDAPVFTPTSTGAAVTQQRFRPNSMTGGKENDSSRATDKISGSGETSETVDSQNKSAQALFRYALIFINFTFIVASLLMIMAGIVARVNSTVQLCQRCRELTVVSIVFGTFLWLFAMLGFNWIRQRNILLLLVYVGFLLLLFLVLLGSIIAGSVMSADADNQKEEVFLEQWKQGVALNTSTLCLIQKTFNCSGFVKGCCFAFNVSNPDQPHCYGNATDQTPPSWVREVCPDCPNQVPNAEICTNKVYGNLRTTLGGFIIISCFSLFLVMTGIGLSGLSRKLNQQSKEG